MLATVAAGLLALGQTGIAAGRYEAMERLRALDQEWLQTLDVGRRIGAATLVHQGHAAYQEGSFSTACQAWDEARASLRGVPLAPRDAISLRFDPPFASPGGAAQLRVGWAYAPKEPRALRLSVGARSFVLAPDRRVTIEIFPTRLNPDLAMTPEVGYYVPVHVDAQPRGAYLSILKNASGRIASLVKSKSLTAAGIGTYLESALDAGEGDVPLTQMIFLAEGLEDGRARLEQLDSLPLVESEGTSFRIAFPRPMPKVPVTVVVGFPGAGFSEHSFFEVYGRGAVVREALRRGQVFVGAREAGAGRAAVSWLKRVRGLKVARVFLLGHGAGAGMALHESGIEPAPSAIALFGADPTLVPEVRSMPLFIAAGRQDTPARVEWARTTAERHRAGAPVRREEPEGCENLMVVGATAAQAYEFFERSR